MTTAKDEIEKAPVTRKHKVIVPYIDKETSHYHLVGEVVTLSDARYAELKKKGHVK